MDDEPPCLAEKILCELIVQLLRRDLLSQADLADMEYRLPEEASHLLKALLLEAGTPP